MVERVHKQAEHQRAALAGGGFVFIDRKIDDIRIVEMMHIVIGFVYALNAQCELFVSFIQCNEKDEVIGKVGAVDSRDIEIFVVQELPFNLARTADSVFI